MLTVGLTGGIGSGKSTVATLFSELGVAVIDTDHIAHTLTAVDHEALDEIRGAFGDTVIQPDGSLDRTALRSIVFADAEARHQLEGILHPRIRQEVMRQHARTMAPYVLIAIPLLAEVGGYDDLLDRVLVVDCPEPVQIARVMARSELPAAMVDAILAVQADGTERLAIADDVIENTGSIEALRDQVVTMNQYYLALAQDGLP